MSQNKLNLPNLRPGLGQVQYAWPYRSKQSISQFCSGCGWLTQTSFQVHWKNN